MYVEARHHVSLEFRQSDTTGAFVLLSSHKRSSALRSPRFHHGARNPHIMSQVKPPGGVVNKDGFFYKLKAKGKQDPLVPIGMVLTSGVLFGGLYSMVAGNSAQLSQKFMRARVVAQAATVVVMCTGGIMLGNQSLGEQPNKRDAYEEMLLAQIEERRQEDKARAARVAALTEKPKA